MARYGQRIGPAAIFAIPAALTVVTGMSVGDAWDEGELLILASGQFRNFGGALSNTQFAVFLDGVLVTGLIRQINIAAGEFGNFAMHGLIPIAEGRHTVELLAQEAGATVSDMRDRRSVLTVVQLPVWYPTGNLITL